MCVQDFDMYSYLFNMFNIHAIMSNNSNIKSRMLEYFVPWLSFSLRPWPCLSLCDWRWCRSLEMDVVGARLRQTNVK